MSTLRRLLIAVGGWILGLFTALSWVWVGEGKSNLGPGSGGFYFLACVLCSPISVFLVGTTVLGLVVYAIDGTEGPK